MNAHVSETCGNRNRFVRDDPDLAGANTIHFHWKSHGRIDRAHAAISKSSHNVVRNFIDSFARLMKFDIGRRSRRTANGLAIHSEYETDKRLRWLEKSKDVGPLNAKFGMIDINEANIIRARIEAQLAEPMTIEDC